MRIWGKAASTRIGVSISDASIECVEIRVRSGRVYLLALSAVELEPGVVEHGRVLDIDRLAHALRTAMDAGKPNAFSTRIAYLSLPDHVSYFHLFRFPGQLSDAEVANALAFQSEEIIPFSMKEIIGDFSVIARTDEGTMVQYAVAERPVIHAYATAFAQAGLNLAGIGLEAQALERVLLAGPREKKASLMADVGSHDTVFSVRNEYGLCATFTSGVAGEYFTKAVMEATGLSAEKANSLKHQVGLGKTGDTRSRKAMAKTADLLVGAILHVIHWHKITHPNVMLDEVVFTGGTTLMPEFQSYLSLAIGKADPGVKVRIGEPFARLAGGPAVDVLRSLSEHILYAAAFGTALDGVGGKPSFDFLSASSRPRVQSAAHRMPVALGKNNFSTHGLREWWGVLPERSRIRFAAIPLVFAVILLLFALAWRYRTENRVKDDLQDLGSGVSVTDTFPEVDVTVMLSVTEATDTVLAHLVETVVTVPNLLAYPSNHVSRDRQSSGRVTLTNETADPQTLVANTRLLSEQGILFRLREDAVLPAQKSVEVDIYADQAGASGDIPPSRFSIPGLSTDLQERIYATSTQTMTGGVIASGVLQRDDVLGAAEAGKPSAVLQSENAFGAVLVEGEAFFPEITTATVLEALSEPDVGTETDSAKVTVRYQLRTLAYQEDMVRQMIEKQLLASWGDLPAEGWRIDSMERGQLAEDLSTGTLLLKIVPNTPST